MTNVSTHAATASRRAMLTGSAASLLAGAAIVTAASAAPVAASVAAGEDAELIGACNALDALERHFCSHFSGGDNCIVDDDERDAAVAPILAEQHPLLERICAIRATTTEGIRAKARSLVLWDPDLLAEEEPYWEARMTNSILRDLVGSAAA